MQVIFPRIVGALVFTYVPFIASKPVEPSWFATLVAGVWLVPAALLLLGRRTRLALTLLLCLSLGGYVWGVGGDYLFSWLAIILLATHEHPFERALLLRVMVSVVYGFAVLSKLNPVWLAGDQIAVLGRKVWQLQPFRPILLSSWVVVIAVAVLFVEAWLAIGLWFRRTRVPTAFLGVLTHCMLIVGASRDLLAFSDLLALNLGLLAMYPAFWLLPATETEPLTPEKAFGRSLERVTALATR
ncbi:HTTM domain-containing protein [Egicoccus sp. AB-alg2]|uniref:HTTM domain-containing protein n=1 Tax=Egicoccus sp. AB-alg2 TaxID=3242693 RepID=UPI00359DF573